MLIEIFGATDGRIEDINSYRAELCSNIATFVILDIIRCVYGFTPPKIEHVCDNQSAITATWKDDNKSVFDKTKPDADVIKVTCVAIVELKEHSTVNTLWVRGHADKRGPPCTQHEELNIRTNILAERAQSDLPPVTKPRKNALHFTEQQISVVLRQRKVTSKLPFHISDAIHGSRLQECMIQKECWTPHVFNTIAWDSFSIAFNKLTAAQQIITSKTIYSFWCTSSRHRRDRGQIKDCCFCGSEDEESRHVLTCNGTGAIIYCTGSWEDLSITMVKWPIHQDIWSAFEHGLLHVARHPNKNDTSRPPFGSSLRANQILLNNDAASQTCTGWHNALKGRISCEWSKIWTKAMVAQAAKTCECAILQALWNHTYRSWIFRNNKDHKNDNRAVAEYK
jgi:hypothetical protein